VVIPNELKVVVESTPDTLHGAIRFAGTRVFVKSLFNYVLTGHPIEEFLADFPGVTEQQARAVLNWQASRAAENPN
jgi:uncharacterized protein (DUF433 family)